MLKNSLGVSNIWIILLASECLSQNNLALLESLTSQFDFLKLSIVYDLDSFQGFLTNNRRVSAATMYKLLIPNMADQILGGQFDQCIYLDSDVVVEGNISELFDVDLGEYYIGGVRDRFLSGEGQREIKEKLNLFSLDDYVNAGVLLFNLKEFRCHTEVGNELVKAGYNTEFPYNDQDAINTVCYGKIKILSLRFNINTFCLFDRDHQFYMQYGRDSIKEARNKPVIIHYNSWKKPWLLKVVPLAGKWWKYVSMQDVLIRNNYLNPFLSHYKSPLHVIIKEAIKTILMYFGIFNHIKNILYKHVFDI